MKILFAGGGTGGHFFPIIAIAEELNKIAEEEKFLEMKMYYMAPAPFDINMLYEHGIKYIYVLAGKRRRYFSIFNFLDLFKIGFGIVHAIWIVFTIYPDVIVGKGGYGSFPTLFAGRILRIPIIIHESDTVPGRVNKWASKFARRIATGFPESAKYFAKGSRVAYTGNPLRKNTALPKTEGSFEFFGFEKGIPTIAIFGGSQGAQIINEIIIDALARLVQNYQIIHQVGDRNLKTVEQFSKALLLGNTNQSRYKLFGFLDERTIKMTAGVADIIISRSGAGAITDISAWSKPSILIPITDSNGDHQRQNAFSYARTGAAIVIEEKNLSANILVSEIERIINNTELKEKMIKSASESYKPDAARKIATEIIQIANEHD